MKAPVPIADRAVDRLLTRLAEGEARREGPSGDRVVVIAPHGMKRMRLDRDLLAAVIAADLVVETVNAAVSDVGRLALTATGRARARRAVGGDAAFRLQHGAVAGVAAEGTTRLVDHAESPLAWLARRRDKSGRAFLTSARIAAGERLRADFTLGEMMPTVTSNWSAGRISGGRGPGGLHDLTDRAVAARTRVGVALDAVGNDLAGVLVDVCCFLKGLETVETERRWPARSAKVVLDIALGRLADHYGLAEEARGRDRPGRLRAWGTADHRPSTLAAESG